MPVNKNWVSWRWIYIELKNFLREAPKDCIDFFPLHFFFYLELWILASHIETNKDQNLSSFPHISFVPFSPIFDGKKEIRIDFLSLFSQKRGIILCKAQPIRGLHLNHHNKILIIYSYIFAGDCNRRRVRSGITRRSWHHSSRTDTDVTLSRRSSTKYGTKMETPSKWATY